MINETVEGDRSTTGERPLRLDGDCGRSLWIVGTSLMRRDAVGSMPNKNMIRTAPTGRTPNTAR
jgi:hypothetical protein